MWSLLRALAGKLNRKNRKDRRVASRRPSLEVLEDRLAPATLTVNTSTDVVHPTDGTLSLRDAINAVNAGSENGLTTGEQGQIVGQLGVNDTIQFASNLNGQTITLTGGALAISASVALAGPGASNLAVSGGSSPALTVSSGTVSVTGMTLTTATTAPTILVTGGSLELRNDDVESSTGSAQACIALTGGSLDLGSNADHGGNTFNINGTGTWFANTTSSPITFGGDTFEINGVAQSVVTWTGNDGNGEWDDVYNWQGNMRPGPNDVALITQAGITVVHDLGDSDSVYSVQSDAAVVMSGGLLTVGGTSTIDGHFQWQGGELSGPTGSTLTAAGGLTLASSNPVAIVGGLSLINSSGQTATWQTGNLQIALGSSFVNAIGATFNDLANGAEAFGSTGSFVNQGNFTAAFGSSGSGEVAVALNNSGTISVSSGSLELGNSSSNGSYTNSSSIIISDADPNGVLTFGGGWDFTPTSSISAAHVVFDGATVAGSYDATQSTQILSGATFTGTILNVGALQIENSTVDFNPATPVTLTLSSLTLAGTLQGSDSYIVSGAFDWLYGELSGPTGSTLTAAGGLTLGSNGNPMAIIGGLSLINPSGQTATWQAGNLQIALGSSFVNATGATFNDFVNLASGAEAFGSTGSFVNQGNFTAAFGSGSTGSGAYGELAVALNNSGTISVSSGSLEFGSGNSSGSISDTDPNGLLEFGGGWDFTPTSSISAADVEFDSATVAGSYDATQSTQILSGATFTGTVLNVGALLIDGTADFNPATPVTLTLPSLSLTGTLEGSDSYIVNGAFDWLFGKLSGPTGSTLTAAGGLTLAGSNGNPMTIIGGLSLINSSGQTATWQTGNLQIEVGSSFVNATGATFDDFNDRSATGTYGFGNGLFVNQGTFTAATGNGYGDFEVALNNSGTLSVSSGGLQLGSGISSGSISDTSLNGVVAFDGNWDFTPTSSISATHVRFDAGTTIVAGSYDVTQSTQIVTGSVTLQGNLIEQINGDTPGSGYGQITVTGGDLVLGGTLQPVMINGYEPPVGAVFTLAQATGGVVSGTFQNLPSGATLGASGVLSNGSAYAEVFAVNYPNGVTLTVLGPLTVASNQSTVTASGFQTATNTGTYTSPAGPVTLSASLGTVVNNGNGTWSWSYSPNNGPTQNQTVTITATDPDGSVATTTFALTLYHAQPTASLSGPSVGGLNQSLTFTFGASDTSPIDQAGNFTYLVNWGDGSSSTFSGPSSSTETHVYTSASSPGGYQVTLTATDQDGVVSPMVSQQVGISSPSSLSGLVFADFNNDGHVDFGEQGIAGVTITLKGTDEFGNAVCQCQQTDADGTYLFSDLAPGDYYLTEKQPAGFGQGIDSVGTAGGSLVATDQFFIHLGSGVNGMNYNFAELPPAGGAIQKGQTAGIGFWNNNNGQALIRALNGGTGTQLGCWLATTFTNLYGDGSANDLAGKSNADIAALFQQDFLEHGPKLDAQVLATALSVYVTNATLDPTQVAASYGFTVSGYGLGTATVNVGGDGAAVSVANNTTVTVLDALLAADAQAVKGVLYNSDTTLRKEANDLFSAINQAGSIS
jgi:hypothetical protein